MRVRTRFSHPEVRRMSGFTRDGTAESVGISGANGDVENRFYGNPGKIIFPSVAETHNGWMMPSLLNVMTTQ